MATYYRTHFRLVEKPIPHLEQENIALDELTPEHRSILKKFFALYESGCSVATFNNAMQNPGNMKALGCKTWLDGQYYWSKEITDLPILKIIEGMFDVLCIRQRYAAHEDTSYMEKNEKTLREFLR